MDFFESIIESVKNQTMNGLVLNFCENEEQRKQMKKVLEAFNRRGISTETFIEAVSEGMGSENSMKQEFEQKKEKRIYGCEFCGNGEHLNTYDKYGNRIDLEFCPICGRRIGND